ncbi:hypothetical protein Lalb_Chr22g0354891 [Lupinus albus]|uniref:Uncharacterized protein n=1 Tax=Lupinus albus TaxID=3870 RepID=A0A6A4N0V9_LUPAL|nr:hypothetical protein Lalb_Chr22g0354891 [Lupinus albus]
MANPLLTRHVLLHRLRFHHNYRSLTVAAPYRLWCNAATPTTNDLDYKEDEPIVVLTKDILHSSSAVDRHHQFQHSRCLFVVRTDGSCIDFSYRKCLRGYIRDKYPAHAERFIRALFKRGSI